MQKICPVTPQVHDPLTHDWPDGHALPQARMSPAAPQLALLVRGLTQRPPQNSWPDGHAQAPETQL